MTKDEALKLALEALTNELACDRTNDADDDAAAEQMYDAITAIKEALAQPEQDAAAFIAAEDRKVASRYGYVPKLHPSEWQDVQPEQEPVGFAVMERPWVGLTEVDILAESKHWRNPEDFRCGVYWAETTLKEKNT